jgi:hypothetical protein
VLRSREGHITGVVVERQAIPIGHLVAFTYRQGEVILLNPIEINDPDPNLSAVLDLPLVHQLTNTGLKIEKAHFELEHPD